MEIIRYESPFDYGEVVDRWTEVFGIDEARLEELQVNGSETEHNTDFVYVAKEGDTLLGTVHATIPVNYPKLCGVSGVCTTPGARGMGVGKLLFSKMVEDMDKMGVETSFLGTGNMIAAKLYGNNGFEFYPGSYIMYRQKGGKIVDFQKTTFGEKPEKFTIVEGNQSFRIPIIPLVLNSCGSIGDINTNITTGNFSQIYCMSLYPRYLKLKENGGYYFGAVSERNLLGAMASVVGTDEGNRCDFFFSSNFAETVPQLVVKCMDVAGEVYLQIAECDMSKTRIAESMGFVTCKKVDFEYNNCAIRTKIYRMG